MNRKKLIQRAKQNAAKREKQFRDIRTQKVLGKLIQKKLMIVPGIAPYRGQTFLEDAIWVGENIEPRIFELLPAIVLKLPHVFVTLNPMPEDLTNILNELKANQPVTPYRGVAPKKYQDWLMKIGRVNVLPARLKTFRFLQEDLKSLAELIRITGKTEAQILRDALKNLLQSLQTQPTDKTET